MFRFNGFSITIMKDHVLATQGMVQFIFSSLEEALDILSQ